VAGKKWKEEYKDLDLKRYESFSFSFPEEVQANFGETVPFKVIATVNSTVFDPIECSTTVLSFLPSRKVVIEEATFDIGYWISYAQSCAQGLGLRLESSAVDCWDNPIGAGPHSTCLERDISSRLNRYANDPDITDVWIWYESTGGNNYNIYIGYA
jgi:hypothetical protein